MIFQPVRGRASLGWLVVDQQALSEYRYRAVREVLGGSPIGEVAVWYGTSRQSLDAWRGRRGRGHAWSGGPFAAAVVEPGPGAR